jgi:EmrB/QacA subfamily drug resistance transporter
VITDAPTTTASGRRVRPGLVLAIVLTAAFVQLVDVSITNVAVPSIRTDLDASFSSVQLVQSGYQLAFACTLITAARLGDLFGRRRLFIVGMAGFTLASILCGTATGPLFLVLARVLQGFMSGLMYPQVLSVIQAVYPPKERPRAFAALGATVGLATILGPLLGGALIELDIAGSQWRSIFLVNVPIGVAAIVAAVRLLPESRAPQATSLDVPGAILSALTLLLLILPLTEGRERGWPWWLIAMLVASVPSGALFIAVQRRKTRDDDSPLVDLRLLDLKGPRVGMPLSLVFFAGVPAFFFTFSLYLQVGEGFEALQSGLTTIPFAIASGILSSRSAGLVRRLGRSTLLLGCLLIAAGMLTAIATVLMVGADPRPWDFIPAFVLAGAGLGMFAAPNTAVILDGVPPRQAGQASGVLATSQQVGGAIGVALVGIVFFGVLSSHAPAAAADQASTLRAQLTSAGLPAGQADEAVRGFEQCFVDRASSSDPSAQPPSCRAVQSADAPPAVTTAFTEAARQAQSATFGRAIVYGLAYEAAVFLLAALLVLRLPRQVRPGGKAPAAGQEAGASRNR